MEHIFGQHDHQVRMDWGAVGAKSLQADVAVVVDVLSFSTSVCVAAERGIRVYPCPWRDERAESFARQHDAVLSVGRLEATREAAVPAPSLSPATLMACEPVPRLVLPSPNGSTIAATLQERGSQVVVGCLRNATAVAHWLAPRVERGASVAVIAAGERWSADDSLRPAIEDHLGAGGVIAALARTVSSARLSPEALTAMQLFEAASDDLDSHLHDCVGGRELTARGFAADVDVAADLDSSTVVPVLAEGAFAPAG